MAKCFIHDVKFADNGKCPRCSTCKHENFWMNEEDFKLGRFRCNGCYKVFKSVPEGKEVFVLFQGKWVPYAELKGDQAVVAVKVVEKVIEETNEVHLAICQLCGKEFEPQRSTGKFCSDNCRVKYGRLKKKGEHE